MVRWMSRFTCITLIACGAWFGSTGWAQVMGRVVDKISQAPIAGARVRIHKGSILAVTAANGTFSLADATPVPYQLTGSAYGYYNNYTFVSQASGTTNLTIELERVPLTITPNHPINQPISCEGCHDTLTEQWRGSPMQKTGLNTWVFDLYDGTGTAEGSQGFVYKRDSIHRTTSPNSDCSACHSPIHWLADIENNGMGDLSNPNNDMRNGVQCEVCHRAYDVDINQTYMPGVQPESFHLLRGPQDVEFGPLGDATYEQGIMRPAYNPQLRAQICSGCHEDNVDHDGDGEFNDPGSLPHETTFTEWRNWGVLSPDHTQACADCHMAALQTDSFCIFVEGRAPGTIRSHDIRGTTPEFLENALTLNVATRQDLNSLYVDVALVNDLTGHAVPSGVVVRNVILLVIAKDQNGNRLNLRSGDLVDEVGGVGDFDDGDYAGHPGAAFYRNMSDGTNERIFYTDAQTIVSDTRIQPGSSYQGVFRFNIDGSQAASVDVKVLYRRAFRDFVLVKNWTSTGHGEPLADIEAPHFGHVMERHESSVNFCAAKDLDSSGAVNLTDIRLMAPDWGNPPPFGDEAQTNVAHFISMVQCFE